MYSKKKKEAADNRAALANAKEDLDATREQKSADIEFLSNLKLQCNDIDSQMAERSELRAKEIQAVSEAITILTEDDNREQLAKSSFVQTSMSTRMHTENRMRGKALKALLGVNSQSDDEDLLAEWKANAGGIQGTNPFMDKTQELAAKQESYVAQLKGQQRQKLAAIALAVSLDSFSKVKEAMDKLIAELKADM